MAGRSGEKKRTEFRACCIGSIGGTSLRSTSDIDERVWSKNYDTKGKQVERFETF